jgi:CRP-like cAMP-binding protein
MQQFSLISFRKDSYIFIEGKHAEQRFFIIREGLVRITRQETFAKDSDKPILGPGDFIGLVSAMAEQSQIESAQAVTDVVLLAVPCSKFEEFIQGNPVVAMKIIQQFSRRMRDLNNALTSINFGGLNQAPDTSVLLHTGEFYLRSKMYRQAAYVFTRYIECYPEGEFAAQAAGYMEQLKDYAPPAEPEVRGDLLRTYGKDSVIFAEGEIGYTLYVIQKGSVKIVKVVNGNEIILAILNNGDIFGEMAALEDEPRFAARSAGAVVQKDNTVLMVMSKQNFEFMAQTHPAIISRLIGILSKRIWFSYKHLSNATLKDPIGRAYNYLLIVLEKNNIARVGGMTYIFDFGPEELMKMAAVPAGQHGSVTREILKSGLVSLYNNEKLFVKDIGELFKIGAYYKKMQSRQGGGGGQVR